MTQPKQKLSPETKAPRDGTTARYDVIVIGGGQAGLSVGYYLKQKNLRFVILDAHARVGDTWRSRWDSLRLFSPNRLNGLDGYPFPGHPDAFASKDAMADYLEDYAARFALPLRHGCRVERLFRRDGSFVLQCGSEQFVADQVVVAMGSFQTPRIPPFASGLKREIKQLHASAYKNPAQLAAGSVMVVGAGNSGAEIAMDLAKTHRVTLVGPRVNEMPVKHGSWFATRLFVPFLMRVIFHRLLTLRTPLGRKARPAMLGEATPLIRTKTRDLVNAGVRRIEAHVSGVKDGLPVLEDGGVVDVDNVIWCNGFQAGQSFIELPVFDREGSLEHEGGMVRVQPGLYFVGLTFLYAMSSGMVHGVGRDAARIVEAVAERARAATSTQGGVVTPARALA
ncbi:MAG: NAD(P)-binding domain-containing protein [Myxococcales bacterium]